MSTFFSDDKEVSSAAKEHLLDPSDDDEDFLRYMEIHLPPLKSPPSTQGTSNNQPHNVSDAVVVDGNTPRLQEITKQFVGSSDQPTPNNNTAFQRTPMISKNEGGFVGQEAIAPISGEEAETLSSHVSIGYQESNANPFPPPLNQDQYFFHRDPSNPRINDQHPYSSYDLHNLSGNSSHAMTAPAAWPPLAPDGTRFSMPNCSSDQRPEISPLPSTSHVAFAGAQGDQHINNFVTAPTENSLVPVLQNGPHSPQWMWDVDQSFSVEVVEDAMPLEIIPSSVSNGGVDDKEKKQVRWTVDEHKAMLRGIIKHGKGKWKIISREFVISKSPVQIASHYQKYDAHQKAKKETEYISVESKRKKRKSIHDITIDDLGSEINDRGNPSNENVEHDFEVGRHSGTKNGTAI